MNLSENFVIQKNVNRNTQNIKNGVSFKEESTSKDFKSFNPQNLKIKVEDKQETGIKKWDLKAQEKQFSAIFDDQSSKDWKTASQMKSHEHSMLQAHRPSYSQFEDSSLDPKRRRKTSNQV